MTQSDFNRSILTFVQDYNNDDRTSRDFSYDFCQLYFRNNEATFLINNMERSCYVLWGYLSSFGMLRGSSELLNRNPSVLSSVVTFVADNSLYDIDLDNYTEVESRHRVIEAYHGIEESLERINPSPTLISKILLGVYSCVPAFDTFFSNYLRHNMGVRFTVNRLNDVLLYLYDEFYNIEVPQLYLRQFDGSDSEILIKKVRFVDRLGWQIGATML